MPPEGFLFDVTDEVKCRQYQLLEEKLQNVYNFQEEMKLPAPHQKMSIFLNDESDSGCDNTKV